MNRTNLVLGMSTDEKTFQSTIVLVNLDNPKERLTLVTDIPQGEGIGVAQSLRAQLGHTILGPTLSPGIQLGLGQ